MTTADVFVPEVWSAQAIVARENNLVFASLANRKFEDGLTFGDTIHVPSVTNLTAQTKGRTGGTQNNAIVFETQTETNTDISIATWEYSAIAVESVVKVQANRDMLAIYAGKMGYALDLAVDDVLAGMIDDLSSYTVGTLNVALTFPNVLEGLQDLDDSNVPYSDRAIVVSPRQLYNWLQQDEFIHADYSAIHGQPTSPAGKAYRRSWMNVPVYESTNVEGDNSNGHDNALIHKECLALVMQMKPTSHSAYDINYLTDKVVLEQLYGTKEMREDHGVWLKGL